MRVGDRSELGEDGGKDKGEIEPEVELQSGEVDLQLWEAMALDGRSQLRRFARDGQKFVGWSMVQWLYTGPLLMVREVGRLGLGLGYEIYICTFIEQ